ncbi:MAG: PAS domain S-box protein [Pyrinomonadaceae bacterium]|nr:PAS domain S-box protein [Pyrinomonadaceae bacterium]
MNEQGTRNKEPYMRLAEINRAITTSLKFDKVLDLIVENAAQLVGADTILLFLVDKDGFLRVRAAKGVNRALIDSFSGSVEGDVIRQLQKALEVPDEQTLVSVPVIAKNSLTGLLIISRNLPLNGEEEWQLAALADQAAIALSNARLHQMELLEATRERDETLEALRESNQRVNNILESITDLFYLVDREWRFVEINRQTQARFGKSRDELIGRVIWEVYPSAIDSSLFPNLHKAMEENVAVHFELASKLVPGAWFEVHAYPATEGLSVYLRDITDRKRADVTNHLLASIVESSEDAIVSKDLNGIINSWNKSAERIFGYTAREAIGHPITMLIPPDRFDEEPAILERVMKGQSVDHYETVRQCKDGSLIDISLTISPIRNEEGVVIGASKIARDIGERKRTEEEVRFQAHLLSAVEQAVIATDLKGTVLYWNVFAEWLYGWTSVEAIGMNIIDLTAAPATREMAAEIMARLREGDSWTGEFLVRKKDGSVFPAQVTDSPIFGENGELIGFVGVSIDITERKSVEEERIRLLESERQARSEAEEANRIKDEFLATLSHELRNPLNVILGYAEVLVRSEEAKRSAFVKRAAEILKRNALAQSQLVRDLLDLSRLHMGKLSLNREAVSLMTTIGNAVETVQAEAAAKEVELKVIAPEEVLFVDADPLRIEQVVWNLLNNAVKFTSAGGTVTVRISSEANQGVVSVEDTGEGIDRTFIPHVFEMFRQADATNSRRHGGLGIGLALVQQLIQLHDGTVAVSSEGLGQGAQFTIKLPLSRESKQVLSNVPQTEDGALSQMRILVVDDSLDSVDMLRRLFEMDGAIVSTARSGPEALQIVTNEHFDVILSDISMPGMDGFELLRLLRELPGVRDTPVLALTGFGRAEDVARAKAEGFFSHVTKPIDLGQLVETLQELRVKTRLKASAGAE